MLEPLAFSSFEFEKYKLATAVLVVVLVALEWPRLPRLIKFFVACLVAFEIDMDGDGGGNDGLFLIENNSIYILHLKRKTKTKISFNFKECF